MKTLTIYLAVIAAVLIVKTSSAEVSDTSKVVKKIIKTIEIDEDGKTIVDSTFVYDNDEVKVFVRTLPANCPRAEKGNGKNIERRMYSQRGNMAWNADNECQYDVTVETIDGDSSKVIIMKNPRGMMQEQKFGPNMRKHKRMMMMQDNEDFNFPPMHFQQHQRPNMIDLNDPEIVSFEKETLKNGDEKITIIRKAEK